jgi:pantothenate kinase
MIGIAGAPGAGKTTYAERLTAASAHDGVPAAYVPMDGFHLADVALTRLGILDRKGAPETFDAWGFAALLHRLRRRPDHVVWAPGFDRGLEQPLAGALAVGPEAETVVTEGNYLLLDRPPWPQVRAALSEVWYVEADAGVRLERLLARHVEFGKSPAEARAWVAAVDEPNARLVERGRAAADLVVRC